MITINELKNKIDNNSRLVGLDLGTKRFGISICDDKRLIATPFKTVNYSNINNLTGELKLIILENNIKALIVGYPINMDGSLGKATQSIRDKASIISKKLNISLSLWDERLSTAGAFNISRQLDVNISKRTKKIDQNLHCPRANNILGTLEKFPH